MLFISCRAYDARFCGNSIIGGNKLPRGKQRGILKKYLLFVSRDGELIKI